MNKWNDIIKNTLSRMVYCKAVCNSRPKTNPENVRHHFNKDKMPIEHHDYLIPIDTKAILWRYMDFNKFISLLETESLFFCRADKFSDPFEGTIPKKEAEYRESSFRQIIDAYNEPFKTDKFNKWEAESIDFIKRTRIGTVINCWHINNYESDSMWRLYLKTNEGVAVQTTPQRLFDSFIQAQDKIFPSKVRYIDFENDMFYHETEYPVESVNTLTPFLHKRVEFNSENEFRIFQEIKDVMFYQGVSYWDNKENHIGIFTKINVIKLIEKVHFHPTLAEKQQKKIELIAKNLGYNLNFEKSSMQKQPLY